VKEFKNDENLSIINKTNNPTKGEKRYKIKGPKSWETKNIPKKADRKGNKKKSST
jgi:ribosome biogenesis protein Nip4